MVGPHGSTEPRLSGPTVWEPLSYYHHYAMDNGSIYACRKGGVLVWPTHTRDPSLHTLSPITEFSHVKQRERSKFYLFFEGIHFSLTYESAVYAVLKQTACDRYYCTSYTELTKYRKWNTTNKRMIITRRYCFSDVCPSACMSVCLSAACPHIIDSLGRNTCYSA